MYCHHSFKTDFGCQPICNTTALNFDNGYCLCGRDCLPSMMDDGICNVECLTPKCGYNDVENCQQCAKGCPLKPDACIPECLNVKCRYASGDFCSSIHKTYSFFSQLKARNLKQAFDVVRDCLDKHPECSFAYLYDENCHSECNNEDCLYDMYACDSRPQTGECKRSRLTNTKECIQCNTIRGVLQYTLYTVCVSTCPFGFTTDEYNGYKLCMYDDTSYSVPAEFYVSTSGSDATSDGSLSKPFFSISYAMSRIRNDQVTFYLMKGPHQLSRITHSDTMKTLIGETKPLNFFGEINPTKIEIRPLFCSRVSHSQCVPDGEKAVINLSEIITLDIVNTVFISDIIFIGKFDLTLGKFGSISGDFMYYCANIRYNSSDGKYYDDRNIELPSSNVSKPEDCESYHEKYFIDVHPTGSLVIQNSEFRDFRQELKAIIYSRGGNILLQDAEFSNIRVASNENSAVVYIMDCAEDYSCGTFEYLRGSVSLLNNGYEYSDHLKFSGFLAMKGMTRVNIEDVEFDKNLVYIGRLLYEESKRGLGTLMYFENSREIILKNLKFTSNYVQEGMINFITNQELSYELDEDNKLSNFYHDHIHLDSLEFRNNGASKTLGIKIEMSFELLNILMNKITFEHNFSQDSSLISIYQLDSAYKDIWIQGGLQRVPIDYMIRDVYFPSRSLSLNFVSVLNSKSSNNIIILNNLANIQISNLVLYNVTSTDISEGNVAEIMNDMISDDSTYIKFHIQSYYSANNNFAFLHFSKSHKLEFKEGNFTSNSGATLLKLDSSMISTSISNLLLANNTIISVGAIGMYLNIDSNTTMRNITCIGNTNLGDSGVGVLKLSSMGDHSITLSDSIFIGNSAPSAGAIDIESLHSVSLINCIFKDNTALAETGGAIVLRVSEKFDSYRFFIDSTRFERNSALKGAGGSIVIDNSQRSLSSLLLRISDSEFLDGFSDLEASSIYISERINLNDQSYVSNSSFLNNISNNKGTLFLAFFRGKLLISDCKFEHNSNIQGVSIYSINKNGNPDQKLVIVIKSSRFQLNSGNSMIYMEGIRGNTELYSESCYFNDNSANVIHMIQSYWEDTSSEFKNNRSMYGGVGALYDNSKVRLRSSTLDGNVADYDGGAIYAFYNSDFFCNNCTIMNNYAKKNGGVIYTQLKSKFSIIDSKMFKNSVDKHGSVVFSIDSEEKSSIKSSYLYSNHAGEGGTLFNLKFSLELKDTKFYENTAVKETAGIMLTLSSISVYNCTFSDQLAEDGVFFHMTTESSLSMRNSTVTNGIANNFGGAIYCISSNVTIEHSTISHNTASSGGSIFSYTSSYIYIHHSDINNSSATLSGGVIKSANSKIEIHKSVFSNYENGALVGDKMDRVYIKDSILEYGSSPYGGSISCSKCNAVSIEGNLFNKNYGVHGGAIYLSNSMLQEQNSSFNIINNAFSHNQAHAGGALYIKDVNINIMNNTFTDNSAGIYTEEPIIDLTNGLGGGVYSSCSISEICQITLQDNTFANNSAFTNGGAIAMYDFLPRLLANTFFNNSAVYGNDVSSYPIRFDFKHVNDSYDREFSSIPILASYSNIASGQVNKELQFQLELLDHFDQVVVTDYSSQIEVIPKYSSNTTLIGKAKVTAIAGLFQLNEFIVSSTPGSSTSLLLKVDTIEAARSKKNKDYTAYVSTALINIQLRECIIGESKVVRDCIVCKSGEYSIDPNEECKSCKSSAICYGNYTMVPKKGYWRASIHTDTFFECLNPDSCIGSDEPPKQPSYTGECAEGYRGNLCNSCEIGYSRASKHTCVECPDTKHNILKLVGLVAIAVVISIIIVYTSMASATKPKSLKSIYIKILLNHFQLVSITSTLKLNWPSLVKIYLSSQENLGILTYQLLSVDCIIASESYDSYIEKVYYTKLILITSIPVIIILACIFYWSIMICYKYDKVYLRRELIASIIILLFFAHPSIVISLFSSFNCMEIEPGEYWLIENLDIRCWEGSHSFYVLAVSLPGIIAWCLGIPAICLYMLYRNRRFLDKFKIRIKYSYLFNGYKQEYYYWEFLILYRKIILIICAVFLGSSSQDLQALTVMIIMIISLHLQHTRSPYVYPQLNTLELRSSIVVSTTIYSGLYFLTNHLTYEANVALFVLILSTNAYFLIYWVKNMIIETKIYEIIPYFKKKWSKTIRDTYSDDLFVKKGKAKSTNYIPIPIEYYSQKYDMRNFYLEVVNLKNDKYRYTHSYKFRSQETSSTQVASDQSRLKTSESAKNAMHLNLPIPLAITLHSISSESLKGQEPVLPSISSAETPSIQSLPLRYQIQVSDERQLISNQEIRVTQTYEGIEKPNEDSNKA